MTYLKIIILYLFSIFKLAHIYVGVHLLDWLYKADFIWERKALIFIAALLILIPYAGIIISLDEKINPDKYKDFKC